MHGTRRMTCFVMLVLACDSPRTTAPETIEAPRAATPVPGPGLLVASLSENVDPRLVVRSIARTLAIAIDDPLVRDALAAAIRRSTVRESKLHLQRFLANRGQGISASIDRASNLVGGTFQMAASRAVDLELYIPVSAHRTAWYSDDVLVVGFVESDHEIRSTGGQVEAYDTKGARHLVSYDNPGPRPILVITESETQFAANGEEPPAGSIQAIPGDGGAPPPQNCDLNVPTGTTAWVCSTVINNIGQYEGILRGAPELTIKLYSLAADGTNPQTIGCLQQDQAGVQFFDQNSDVWTGLAQLGTKAAVTAATSQGRRVVVQVWEDDNGSKCDFSAALNQVEGLTSVLAFIAIFGTYWAFDWADSQSCISCANLVRTVAATLATAIFWVVGSQDDFIGFAGLPAAGDPFTVPWNVVTSQCPIDPLNFNCTTTIVGTIRTITRP